MQDKNIKSEQLSKAVGAAVKHYRKSVLNKTITKLTDEYELRSGTWSKLETAAGACKFETIWIVAEAMELRPSELVKMIEDHLGKDFKFIDE